MGSYCSHTEYARDEETTRDTGAPTDFVANFQRYDSDKSMWIAAKYELLENGTFIEITETRKGFLRLYRFACERILVGDDIEKKTDRFPDLPDGAIEDHCVLIPYSQSSYKRALHLVFPNKEVMRGFLASFVKVMKINGDRLPYFNEKLNLTEMELDRGKEPASSRFLKNQDNDIAITFYPTIIVIEQRNVKKNIKEKKV